MDNKNVKKGTKSNQLEKKVVVKIPYQMWENLRRISFESQVSMAQLIRDGAEHIIQKNKKFLNK